MSLKKQILKIKMNQNLSGKPSFQDARNNPEISLRDILTFLTRWYKLILLMGILGVVATYGYLLILPKQYQSSARILFQQRGEIINKNINIEYLVPLVVRLTNNQIDNTAEIANVCDLEKNKYAQVFLSKSVELTIPKGMSNFVELETMGSSPDASFNCAQAVFNLIKTTQFQVMQPLIEDAKVRLLNYQERLANLKDKVTKPDMSELSLIGNYLLNQEIHFLLIQISALEIVVASNENNMTYLVGPIYVSNDPIVTKYNVPLAGLISGLFLGLLIALGVSASSKS